jgi:propanediol dehydratase small subunit
MEKNEVHTKTGKALSELTLESVLAGDVIPEDLEIAAVTLLRQADAVEAGGYLQVAQNLRRSAELTKLSNDEVLEIYRALRPGRATQTRLMAIAERLETEFQAPLTADLIRQAADVYLKRGIAK